MESFHLLSLSRLEYAQCSVLGPILFLIFINDLIDSGKSSLSLCWWLYLLLWHRSSFWQTDRQQQPLPSPQTLTISQTGQTQFCWCIHITRPLHFPLLLIITCIPFFVRLRLLSPSALLLLFPLSPAVPFVMLCPDLFVMCPSSSMSLDHVLNLTKKL